ncbi:sugar MFS transporter [Parabacteroides sp. AM08-6]|uniref:sugar MFS transporter n=1 Tax=Parabacteroides sp. AM08-6 TaxID=2292053 RepID=UPI000EFF353B|nr:sugar MFS transporter [Parabacteroides sp. AM08-6]RHJ77109.1 sugar MFS transporter [Parabacteroides sp. AM08-6]
MEREKKSLVKKEYLIPFILVTSLFFLWGFAHAILDVLNKHFQEALVMTKAHSAFIQATMYTGYFTMAIPAGLFINKYGYRKGVVFGLILYGIGSLLFIPSEHLMSFNFFLFSLFVIGCGLTFLETAANPYVTELGARETAASRLNLAQSFNGLGCICAPVVGGLLLFSEGKETNISLPYTIMGVVVLAVALLFLRIRLPEIDHTEEDKHIETHTGLSGLWKHRRFVWGVAALFCYEIAEISINSFFINYVTDDGWMSTQDAAVVLSFGGLGLFMVGRIIGSWIMSFIRAEKVLFVCAVFTVLASLLITLNLGTLSKGSLFACYIFEAIMFPTIFAISLRGLGGYTKRASSFLMMSPVGGAVGPLLMGYVADASSMSFSFIIPLCGYSVVAIYSYMALMGKIR